MREYWYRFLEIAQFERFPEITWIIGIVLLLTIAFTSGWVAGLARAILIPLCLISIIGTLLAHPHLWPAVVFEIIVIVAVIGSWGEDRVVKN